MKVLQDFFSDSSNGSIDILLHYINSNIDYDYVFTDSTDRLNPPIVISILPIFLSNLSIFPIVQSVQSIFPATLLVFQLYW